MSRFLNRVEEAGEQMDVVHDIIAEEDRISTLPDEIIHRILSFLDMKYAIQTSTLSKKWKHIWTSQPHLNLNSKTFYTLSHFAKFVKHALSHRNHRAEVSAVELTFTGSGDQFVVKSIVKYAYSHNVKQLTMKWFRFTRKVLQFPQCLFSSHTLKHLTLATTEEFFSCLGRFVPNSAWDFPALETLNLSNMQLSDCRGTRDTSLNFFSKCVNLKDLTLHQCSMNNLNIFNVCAPQLSNLTITCPVAFPDVFNVVAPKLENLTATVGVCVTADSKFLHMSTNGLDSLETVNLSLLSYSSEKERYVPQLLDLFQKLCNAKFLILDTSIIQALSSCLDQLSYTPCPFNNLKCLKINMAPLKQKDCIPTMASQVINYLLESSPSAAFIMDLPQMRHKRSRQAIDMGTRAKKVVKLEEEKQPPKTMGEGKRMFETKILLQDEVIVLPPAPAPAPSSANVNLTLSL